MLARLLLLPREHLNDEVLHLGDEVDEGHVRVEAVPFVEPSHSRHKARHGRRVGNVEEMVNVVHKGFHLVRLAHLERA